MKLGRRSFLKGASGIALGSVATPLFNPLLIEPVEAAVKKIKDLPADAAAANEDFWFTVQQAYSSSPTIINLNNGGVSPQPIIVQDAVDRYNRVSNEGPAKFMWHVLGPGRETVREKLANLAGCSPEELAINRNSSEALETIIYGLELKKGDEVLLTHQDYPNMRNAWAQREKRDGIILNKISLPVPIKSKEEVIKLFEAAMTPKTKVVLVTHMINLTGQILPVKEIADIAHAKGIEVICDGAHTFGHLDFKIPDLGCDYFGTSLHKWLCAPFGTGMLYVKKDKISGLWPLFGSHKEPNSDDIRKFEDLGTRAFPSELGIGHAINFHNGIGSARKQARLQYLKKYWVNKVKDIPGIILNASPEIENTCALFNFGIEGKEPGDICNYLYEHYKIYVIAINHDEIKGVRVTPHIYTTLEDLDLFAKGVREFAEKK